MAEHFDCLSSFLVLDSIPVEKYRSKRTGINFCFAKVPGPLVNGFLCLATETHDDDGLPHTLEHLVFMGSENYPYKGLLDLLANRCLAQGTNAWTATDHTAYTMETAGSEGFLNLLPIYLDHVLYPTLTVCSGLSETGGIMENLRSTCSHTKVCNYHQQFYRPENLCVIITGQIDPKKVFETVKSFEDKILTKKALPPYERPWQSSVPPVSQNVEKVVKFPTEDEESGSVLFGFRGPPGMDRYSVSAVSVMLDYLSDTSIAPLQRELVEIQDPFCSDISCDVLEFSETSLLLKLSVLLDTVVVPEGLKPYLCLYLEVLFESPILRDGVLVPYDQVVAQLAGDTLDKVSSLGLKGKRFMPEEFSQLACVSLKLEVEKYEKGVHWLHELLYKTQFTKDRLEIVGRKMMNDVARMKRQGRGVARTLIRDIAFTKDSNMFSANMVRQYSFLNKLLSDLETNAVEVIGKVEKLRSLLTHPSNLRVHVVADVNRLPDNPHVLWKTKLLPNSSLEIPKNPPPVRRVSSFLAANPVHGKIAGVGSVESSFLYQVTHCVESFDHPDLAAIMVFLECLTTLEGPIWRQVRGLGLSYGYAMRVNPENGLLYLQLIKSSHLVKAYKKTQEIVNGHLSGEMEFDAGELESAISSVIFEIIEREKSVSSAASQVSALFLQ
ncbi:PREDICTED: uncharacterized protein C3H1.02c-like [Acropora digitifera]|uniref:uncharacterized protein C3H1.02c-like n=1 Tax=Acropora digitifera TaxID=70779 RepID=UPI00077A9658|nr:PREDICTED: uncharacterized protein C3H1.02c-like [Acropora digitifera]